MNITMYVSSFEDMRQQLVAALRHQARLCDEQRKAFARNASEGKRYEHERDTLQWAANFIESLEIGHPS